MKKQLISILLALCMVLGMLPGTAWATQAGTGKPTTTQRSEVVVRVPGMNPQILYYNNLGQVACCINFNITTDTGDTFFESPEIVTFEYTADGNLKSSDCSHPRLSFGYLQTEFYPPDGHLEYTYTSNGIEAYNTDGELWCVRDTNGRLTTMFNYDGSVGLEYSYINGTNGNLSRITRNSDIYDVTCNDKGQIIRCGRQNNSADYIVPPAVFTYNSSGQMSAATCAINNSSYSISLSYNSTGEISAIQGYGDDGYCTFSDYSFSSKQVGSDLKLTIVRAKGPSDQADETCEVSIPMGVPIQKYNFSYSLDGGSWSFPEEYYTYSAGEQIVIESEAPLKDGCYFAGWSDGNKTYQPGSTYTMPSHDVQLTALWGIGPLNLISIARDNIVVTESYTAAPRYTLADGVTVEWTSADPSIAAVDSNGVVTGVHYGKTAITAVATAAGAKQTVSYPVTVNPNYKISFTNAVVHLAPGKSTELYCNVLPLDGKDHIKFHSDKPEIISVSGNTITAVGEGSATITAFFDPVWLSDFPCEIPPVATCDVTVSNGEVWAQKFVDKALSVAGKKADDFGFSGNWCAEFVAWCARETGGLDNVISSKAGYYFDDIVNKKGGTGFEFYERIRNKSGTVTKVNVINTDKREKYEPKIGDIVIFTWGYTYDKYGNKITVPYGTYIDHVGIVCKVDGKNIGVVHGNYNRQVSTPYNNSKSSWSVDSAEIFAYARPNWDKAVGVPCGTLECRIECPVDVRFAYDNEVLDSATEQFEASFGTMERTGADGLLVHLNNYYNDMDITINGTGVGTMDITSTFRDSDGTTSTRKFQGVPITKDTIGKLFAYNSAATEILEIYKDKGNTFVEVWAADGNSTVSSADEELTDWYLNGYTTDAGLDTPNIPAPSYPIGGNTEGTSNLTTHDIIIPVFLGGAVTIHSASASKGATVTLTATPDKGFELSSITVTDSKGNVLELTDKGDSKYTFVMPASAVTVNAVFEKMEPAESTPVDETYIFPFTDVLRTDWFCNAVEYVFTNGLMSGTALYTFNPQGKMNRAMVWTVLGRMADADVDGSESPWYSKAQAWAMSNNVSDGTNPTNSISRQELMTMLWRYIGSPAATSDLNKFSDSESVADWADDAMQWAMSTGLIVGDNGRLNPTDDARRCEVATIFMRFCESIAE